MTPKQEQATLLVGIDDGSKIGDYTAVAMKCMRCHSIFDISVFEAGEAITYKTPSQCPHCGTIFDKVQEC